MTSSTEAKRRSEEISQVSNVAYDLLTVMQNKLKGIGAIEEYKLDCEQADDRECLSLLEELQRREQEDVERIRQFVKARL